MRFVITVRAEKSPKDKKEVDLVEELRASGLFDEWLLKREKVLREHLQEELDDPDVLDVSITVEDGDE